MRSARDILELLDELDAREADELEGQDLDFKQWPASRREAEDALVEMAVCMANGGGGTTVFGVADRVVGRARAVLGVPPEVDANVLRRAVYDRTDPKLTPELEFVPVPEGTGLLLAMHVRGGLPPYTDTSGRGKVRVGKDCQPLTGSLRASLTVEFGANDYTAEPVPGVPAEHVSASALEVLRRVAGAEFGAPKDLLRLSDADLLAQLNLVVPDGRLTRAGVLLVGTTEALRRHLPSYTWTFLQMRGDTDYVNRADGPDALAVALTKIVERVTPLNPIETVRRGLYHFEYRLYPELALREALINALCHANLRAASPVTVKQYADRLEITNPGGFVGGVSPANILHHPSAARNPRLVEALIRLRMANRSNLGVGRMYSAMLIEGKDPPLHEDAGQAVRTTFRASPLSPSFRAFVEEEEHAGRHLSVDALLVLKHLLRHVEVDLSTAATVCQRTPTQARELLADMALSRRYLKRSGAEPTHHWTLRRDVRRRLVGPDQANRTQRDAWRDARRRILGELQRRATSGHEGLSNAEIRELTHFDRESAKKLLRELRDEGSVQVSGAGRYSRWTLR